MSPNLPAAGGALVRLRTLDAALCLKCNRVLRFPLVPSFLRAVSWLGNGIFWYALMLALLVQNGRDGALPVLHMAFCGAVGVAAYRMIKRRTVRPRPYQVVRGIAAGVEPLDAFSFPSGHTLHAVSFTLVAGFHYPALAPLLAAFAVLTAVSRVALGLHYPSDVAAGAALGAAIAGASFLIA